MSPPFVAVTVQVPTPTAVRVAPLTLQALPPAVTAKFTGPLPAPPLVAKVAVAKN